ncbi:uncharacterized protein V6R79_007284 [Siganus canaliculatus]
MDTVSQCCQSGAAFLLRRKMTFNSLIKLIGLTVGQRRIDRPLAIEMEKIDNPDKRTSLLKTICLIQLAENTGKSALNISFSPPLELANARKLEAIFASQSAALRKMVCQSEASLAEALPVLIQVLLFSTGNITAFIPNLTS